MATYAATVPRIEDRVFLVLCRDGPDSAASRDAHLEGHLLFIEQHLNRYLVCGPLRKPGSDALCGSFFLVRADSEADARALLKGDPYLACGMYESIEVLESTPAAGTWQQGVIWDSAEALRARTDHPDRS